MLKDKATRSQLVATIRNVREEAIRLRDSMINRATAMYEERIKEEQKKNPEVKIERKQIKKRVSLTVSEIVNKSTIKIESEEDIDAFVNDLRQKLKDKLNDDIIINVK